MDSDTLTLGKGQVSFDAASAAKEIGVPLSGKGAPCWAAAATSKKVDAESISFICPHKGDPDHDGLFSEAHKKAKEVKLKHRKTLAKHTKMVQDFEEAVQEPSALHSPPPRSSTPAVLLPLAFTMVALFAGVDHVGFALAGMHTAVTLLAYSETASHINRFLREHAPNAQELGACENANVTHLSPDFATATFECAGYTESGLLKMQDDKRARQADDAADALLAMLPKYILLEQVLNFFKLDGVHGRHSNFVQRLHQFYFAHDIVWLNDAKLGGYFDRLRGFQRPELPLETDSCAGFRV